jgi:hypothetical protein
VTRNDDDDDDDDNNNNLGYIADFISVVVRSDRQREPLIKHSFTDSAIDEGRDPMEMKMLGTLARVEQVAVLCTQPLDELASTTTFVQVHFVTTRARYSL